MYDLLPISHPTIALSGPLKDYCDRFLKKYNLNYFQIIRVNDDGSTAILTNQPEYIQFVFSYAKKSDIPCIYSCLKEKEVLNPALYYFLWEPNLPSLPVSLAREFDICNGLTFVERFPTHYYMFGFATPSSNRGILDFYINNIELLQNFIRNFKEEQKKLLLTLESNPIILPAKQIDTNLQSMLLKNGYKIPINFQNRSSYITMQEYHCLQKLKLGYSAKEIARFLNISPRTVEEYFLRIKSRTGCSKKQHLLHLI